MNEAVVQTNIYFVLQQIILMNLRRSDFVLSKIYLHTHLGQIFVNYFLERTGYEN